MTGSIVNSVLNTTDGGTLKVALESPLLNVDQAGNLKVVLDEQPLGSSPQTTSLVWSEVVNRTVTTASEELLEADETLEILEICNLSDSAKVYINFLTEAGPNSALYIIQPNQTYILDQGLAEPINIYANESSTNISYRVATNV